MKKIFALVLCLIMVLPLVSCGKAEYKLGMGVVVSTDSSSSASVDANGKDVNANAQVDATVATVITDENGVIVACRIDVAQNKMSVTNEGIVEPVVDEDGDPIVDEEGNTSVNYAKEFKTKMEKANAYGMASAKIDNDLNGVTNEWYEQVHAFEAYVVGMTADQVANIRTQYVNGHWIATDKALLNAGCSMQITDFIEAVVKACDDVQGVTFKAKANKKMTLGVAATSFVDAATVSATTKNAEVHMYTDFACAVVVKGKIVATLNDAIQPKIFFDDEGQLVKTEYKGTKRELRDNYNMAKYGKNMDWNGDGKVLEWYLQSQAFSKYVIGMTAEQVVAMETKTLESGYVISADNNLLSAGCTIQIKDICAVVAKAANNATSIK